MKTAQEFAADLQSRMDQSRDVKGKPEVMERMIRNNGGDAVKVVKKMVLQPELHEGFLRMIRLGHERLTLEATILEYPELFTSEELACAQWRLESARKVAFDSKSATAN